MQKSRKNNKLFKNCLPFLFSFIYFRFTLQLSILLLTLYLNIKFQGSLKNKQLDFPIIRAIAIRPNIFHEQLAATWDWSGWLHAQGIRNVSLHTPMGGGIY